MPAAALGASHQALLGHDRRDGVHTDDPALVAKISTDPRGPVFTFMRREQPTDVCGQCPAASMPW
jgi:hypothetical protein